jgi:glycosyltransferase involved in cell wall biosynthesis
MSLKVSILIPLYNSEEYITDTIQSALNQTYTNIEIIIVDDGSTDNSYDIAKSYKSETVKVYKQKNSGASAARNNAFSKCSGDLIQYLDADDILHPEKVENQVKVYTRSNKANIIISGIWGRFEKKIENVKWENQPINKDYNKPINWLIDSWNGQGMAQPGVWLTPRHIIEKVGPWNESLSLNDDGEFFCRVILNSDAIKFIKESKVYYRSNISSSLSKSRSLSALQSELNSFRFYCTHTLKKHDSIELRKALGQNYLYFIYHYYNFNNELIQKAIDHFSALNIGKMWAVGPTKIRVLSKAIGFLNALKIKSQFFK